MKTEPLDSVPLWLLCALICALTALALEGGYRVGRHRARGGESDAPVGAMVGSILALFAFLLAFTFGLAAARFEQRRQTVLDEANTIGTTYLRARQLREPYRSETTRLLREYVDARVRGIQERKVAEALVRSEELHELLWAEATKAAESDPNPITALYIQSLNQMIDLHATRVHVGIRSRIPVSIWAGLAALALLSTASVGYQAGLSLTRRSPTMLGLVLAFSCVLFMIADLDRPGEGFLTVSQQAMVDLQKSMQ